MKAVNSLTNQNQNAKKPFSSVITGDAMQGMIRKSLGDPRAAARFTSTLISAVSGSENLRNCEPNSIISCALQGEGMGLVYGEGYYIVPFGKVATFIPGYKGYIQRSICTGLYADIDCLEIREGERKGRDRRTGRAIIDLSVYDTDEEREAHPVIGVKAYFELRDGYYREEYRSCDELLKHADRYAASFSLATYNKWRNGEKLTEDELRAVKGPYSEFKRWRAGEAIDPKLAKQFGEIGAWYDEGGRQIGMMKKTVLRSLLGSGYAPLSPEVRTFLQIDNMGGVVPETNIPIDLSVDSATGEVLEADAVDVTDTPQEADNAPTAPRKRKTQNETAAPESTEIYAEDDGNASFFNE